MKRLNKLAFLAVAICVGNAYAQYPPRHVAPGNWLMLHGSTGHNGFSSMRGSITGWNLKYTISVGDGEVQPVVGDANGDGVPDIVFVNLNSCNVSSYNGATGNFQWSRNLGGSASYYGNFGALAMADLIPSSPGLEIVVSCGYNRTLALLRGTDGSTIWSNNYGSIAAPAVAYRGPDTLILVTGLDDTLRAFRPNGTLAWSRWIGWVPYTSPSPAVGNINGGTDYEVVVHGGDGNVYALRFSNGSLLWSRYIGSYSATPVTLADLNNDGIDEVLAAYNNTLYALRGSDGSTLWTYTFSVHPYGPISVGDVNNDGLKEVVVGGHPYFGGGVTVLRNNGTLLWQQSFWRPSGAQGGVRAIADFDGDGQMEIAFVPYGSSGPGDGIFRMVNGSTGTIEWSASGVDGEGAAAADVDGDGCVELVIGPPCCGRTDIRVLDGPGTGCGVLGYDDPVSSYEKEVVLMVEVEGVKGGLMLEANRETMFEVFRSDGSKVLNGRVYGKKFVRLPKGVYYVKAGPYSKAVVVR